MADGGGVDFFVSYTAADVAWAKWVSRTLEQAGYRIIVQEYDFGVGNFVAQMENAVTRASRVLPILSDAYLQSDWAREEWTAYARERSIIPVQVAEVGSRSLLRQYTRVNLRGLDEQAARLRLVDKLRKLVGPPAGLASDTASGPDEAPFPGASTAAGLPPEPVPLAAPAPHRQAVERGRLQLVVLGAGPDAAGQLAELLDTPPERILDLHNSPLPVTEQGERLTTLLRDLGSTDVADLVVAFVGRGQVAPGAGLQLHVAATDPAAPQTALGLRQLLELVSNRPSDVRAVLLLDVLDELGRAPVLPDRWGDVPVLDLRGPSGGGLTDLMGLLRGPPVALARVLHHRSALTIGDLAALSGDALHTDADGLDDVGLAPNPLAWPAHPVGRLGNWCAVLSTADRERREGRVELAVQQLEAYQRRLLNGALQRSGRDVELDDEVVRCAADDVLTSPAALAHAVEQVCCAEIAVFDLTNYEPAVMFLLGIRSVVRRGVTLCVHTEHAAPIRAAEPPFHVREISLLSDVDPKVMTRRLRAGVRQRGLPGRGYTDLPSFPLARSVPPDANSRGSRSFDPDGAATILALVPFGADYEAEHWKQLRDNLAAAAASLRDSDADSDDPDDETVRIVRTLDLDSPRVVSTQLHEAMRLTDFCLVDLTTARPNVVYELGVRLAVNPLHPVVVCDPDLDHPFAGQPWAAAARYQCDQLCSLLAAMRYRPYDGPIGQYGAMVQRHLTLRELEVRPNDPRRRSILDGFPPRGIYDLAWRHALVDDEIVTIPVDERLAAAADELLVDQQRGSSYLIYPSGHPLSAEADRAGREHMLAAWLYLHFRGRDGAAPDVLERYAAMTQRLLLLLESSADATDKAFALRVKDWAADGGGEDPEE